MALLPPAFLLLALLAGILPSGTGARAGTGLSVLGFLLSLAAVLARARPATLTLPLGPPSLPLHLALDALSAGFLVLVLASAACVITVEGHGADEPAAVRAGAACIAGVLLILLAGDGMTLAIGLAIACAAIWLDPAQPQPAALLIPLALLAATSLLTPAGFAPRFDTIRAAPPEVMEGTGGALLGVAGVGALIALPLGFRSPMRDALHAGMLLPAALFTLLRLVLDVSAAAGQPLWGEAMMLVGGVIAVCQGWIAGAARDVDVAAGALARCQAGLAMAGCGLALRCRLADLPAGAADALAGVLLLTMGGLAATLVTLASHRLAAGAGAYRLSRLGGLLGLMPATAAAASGGLLALSCVPSSLGFAAVWMLLRAVIAAPRTGGLPSQCVLALTAAAIAAAAALAATATLRLAGIVLLSRPRTPQAAAARDIRGPPRTVLMGLSGVVAAIGVLPIPALSLLARPVLQELAGTAAGFDGSAVGSGTGYQPLPVAALLGLCIGLALLVRFWRRREARPASAWLDGRQPPFGLPFGDPAAQAAGRGFVPAVPRLPLRLPRWPALPAWRWRLPQTGLWLILLGAAACLMVLAVGE